MRDRDIRTVLRDQLQLEYGHCDNTLIVDELGVCQGSVRIDLAVVNGALHGYEIKSEHDTLNRLPHQCEHYAKVFDCLTIVVGPSFFPGIKAEVPTWWGVIVAQPVTSGPPRLVVKRKAKKNELVDAYSVAQLLWREEALCLLEKHQLADGVRTKGRKRLWQTLADYLNLDVLRDEVRGILVNREGWRSASSQA